MTATAIVKKLWAKVKGTRGCAGHTDIRDVLRKWTGHTKFNGIWHIWSWRNSEICDDSYTRYRDNIRAYRLNDLRLARDLDRAKKSKK